MLRATTACTFSTSQLPKVVRTVCFVHFDFEMCFAPQRPALFESSTSNSGPNMVCFVHFDFEMRFAPQRRGNFASLIWPDCSAPAALASLLFNPPEPQILGKTQCFATFLPFRAPASSFFSLFLLPDLLSASLFFSDCSHLCFSICPYCRKFDFQISFVYFCGNNNAWQIRQLFFFAAK